MSQAAFPSNHRTGSASARAQGIAYAVTSAALFGCNTNLARVSFASGADAATLNAVRFSVSIAVLFALSALGPARTPLTPRQRLGACAVGVLFFLCSFGYMGAIQYIPVSIAALLLYSYPILVALIARVSERERLGRARVTALVLGFVGIALTLGIAPRGWPDWRGVALSALASGSMSLVVIGSSRLMRVADRGEINRHLMGAAAVLFLAALATRGFARWPADAGGWLAFAGAVGTFTLGQLALIAAIGRAGAVLTASLMNLEPLLTVALAVAALGESLTRLQLVGALLILSAIVLISRRGRARAALAEP